MVRRHKIEVRFFLTEEEGKLLEEQLRPHGGKRGPFAKQLLLEWLRRKTFSKKEVSNERP